MPYPSASPGVPIQARTEGAAKKPNTAMTTASVRKNVALVPVTRFASGRLPAPTFCAMSTVEAIVMPNTAPSSRNITIFALLAPVSAAAPRNLPIQMALIDPLTDCSTLPSRIGNVKMNKVRGMDPSVNVAGFFMIAVRERNRRAAYRIHQQAHRQTHPHGDSTHEY